MLLALGLLMGITGCASLSYENYGHAIDARGHLSPSKTTPAGLVFSAAEATELSNDYTGFVGLDIENRSADWIRIQTMNVSFGGPQKDRAVFVPVGDDLASWQRATVQRNTVRELNTEMALDAVAVSAAVVSAAAGHRRPAGAAAAAVGAVAGAASVGRDIAKGVEAATAAPMYPETHLLATPFTIPPGLFTKRWIVLSTPGRGNHPCIDSMLLDYTLEDGRRERVWLTFRPYVGRSEWQSDVCTQEAATSGWPQ